MRYFNVIASSTLCLTSFLSYFKDIANLLLWELWECLTISIKNHSIKLQETFMLIDGQKVNFVIHLFLKMLQRNSKLVILGNLGMADYAHLKWLYQFDEIFDVYLQAKNQLCSSRFSWDIAKYCKLVVLATLGMPSYTHPKWQYQLVEDFDVYLNVKNKLYHSLPSWDITF